MNMFLGIMLKAEMKAEQNCRNRNEADAEWKRQCTQTGGMRVGEETERAGTVSIPNPEIPSMVLQLSWQGLDIQLVGISSNQRAKAAPLCMKEKSSDWSNYRYDILSTVMCRTVEQVWKEKLKILKKHGKSWKNIWKIGEWVHSS